MSINELNFFHVCDLECDHNKNTKHLHGVICSASCDHEEHERTGFSNDNYSNFSKEDVYDQVDCGVKAYLDLQGTLF